MKVTEQNIQFLNLFHVSGWHTLVSLNSTYVILQVLVSFLRSAYLGASHLNLQPGNSFLVQSCWIALLISLSLVSVYCAVFKLVVLGREVVLLTSFCHASN